MQMKAKAYIIIILGAILLNSCSLLDVEPAMSISEETAVSTKADVSKALNGCYDALQLTGYYGRDLVAVGDIAADNLDATGTIADFRAIDLFNHKADNSIVLNLWAAMYDGINRVNNVLYRIDGVQDMTADEINAVKAELRFLRALHYFNLVRLFGDVPYRELPTLNAGDALHVARTSKDDVYEKILGDLEFALDYVPSNTNFRANIWSTKALLAKVYLTLQHFDLAYNMANEIIENGPFILAPTFDDLFAQDDDSEIIFRVEFNEQDWTRLAQYFAPNILGGRKEFWPTEELVNLFSANDVRLASSVGTDGQGFKYRDIATGSDNVIVFRLADMILTRAEALANTPGSNENDIRTDINSIRNRASLVNYSGSDFLSEIQIQRRLEFAFEGHRWFDLVRTGTATSVLGISQNYTLFPIPKAEITNNNAINETDQNPGY